MMNNFAAIDFEIANQHRSSVCSVGAVIVRNGRITDKIYRLVRPEPEWYLWRITQIHGLTAEDTENEKVFPHVWDEIAPIIDGLPLVAQTARSTRVVYGRYSAYIKWIIPIMSFIVPAGLRGKPSGSCCTAIAFQLLRRIVDLI